MATISECVVCVVDPISTGGCLAAEAASRGYQVVSLWTADLTDDLRAHVPPAAKGLHYLASVDEMESLEETATALKNACGKFELVMVVVGGESGVTLADELSEYLGLRSNGTAIKNRRDKSVQQKLVKAAGLRSTRECFGVSWGAEQQDFVDTEPTPLVVKPVESCGSDGVKVCYSAQEAREHFELLMQSQTKCGVQGAGVILQEFLKGNEYVIDHCSRDGVHKTTMVYEYDKRAVNGAPFVYFGMIPMQSDDPIAQELIKYTRGVLDALGLRNGPSHGEVMMTANGPCLVEMNCRSHGWDGAWIPLASKLTGGYTMVDATIDAYLQPEVFEQLPHTYHEFTAAGLTVMLVSYEAGVAKGTPGFNAIRKLPSFVSLNSGLDVGSEVPVTIDLFSAGGTVVLAHQDPCIVQEDLRTIREMERTNSLFLF